MRKRTLVSEIMSENVIALNNTNDLMFAEKLFKKQNIRHIPVVSGLEIKGMLSYTDLLRISFADAAYDYETDVSITVYNMFTI